MLLTTETHKTNSGQREIIKPNKLVLFERRMGHFEMTENWTASKKFSGCAKNYKLCSLMEHAYTHTHTHINIHNITLLEINSYKCLESES
jgi:hypothetical protein